MCLFWNYFFFPLKQIENNGKISAGVLELGCNTNTDLSRLDVTATVV